MTREQWQQARPILESAIELDPANRSTFLDHACTDTYLRREIESLLAAHEQADTRALNTDFGARLDGLGQSPFQLQSGTRLGTYEILGEIARGGMGAVYRAARADGQYQQHVALKVVRADLGTEFSTSRLRSERQILASLDHPNIAKILDGGTTKDGLPYFVMELIEGLPITEYCAQYRLSIDDRLNLFRNVCSAVHYAHQHLVIHRDLKPTNLLVTPGGVPKLLDFGIAKILDPNTHPQDVTLTGQWIMTPEYASPEQFRGEPITTATDVYSLGLILYELLTGRSVHSTSGRMPHEIARAVLEIEPEKPSSIIRRNTNLNGPAVGQAGNLRDHSRHSLHRRLAGDLDNIVLKALRKEPRERYNSVDQFAEDIRRHLERLPILARKNTIAYRCRKYMLRHKIGVFAAALIIVSLITGVALTIHQARIARASQLRAERRLGQTRELTQSLIGDLANAIGTGATPARVLMDQKAVGYLEQLVREENTNPKLKSDLARAYLRFGEALGNPGLGNMGDIKHAEENYERAISLFETILPANASDDRLRLDLREAYVQKALALGWGDIATAMQVHRTALELFPSQRDGRDFFVENSQAFEYDIIAQVYGDPYFPNLGDTSRALEYIRKAISVAEEEYSTDPKSDFTIHLDYAAKATMADLLWARGKTAEALNFQRRAEALLNANGPSSQPANDGIITDWAPQSQVVREEQAMATVRRANLLAEAGQQTVALDALRESRDTLEILLSTDPANYALRRDLTRNYNLTGSLLTRGGHLPQALEAYRKALSLITVILALESDHPDVQQHLADTYEGMGNTLADMARTSEAIASAEKALAIRESLAKLDPNDARYQFSLAKNYVSVGNVCANAHHQREAIGNYRLAVAIQKSLSAKDPYNTLVARALSDTQRRLENVHSPR